MKRLIGLLIVVASAITADAQILEGLPLNPNDFIRKGVQSKDSTSSSPLSPSPSLSSVQSSQPSSAVSRLLETAVVSDLYIVRQQYRLERKGKTYGKNGSPYYGETYSLGVKVPGGMYVLNTALEPWKGDADYERVNVDGKYKPEYFWTYQRPLAGGPYKTLELDYGTSYISPANADSSLWLHQDLHSDFGLAENKDLGEKEGFMMWAYSNTGAQDSAMVVSLRQFAFKTSVAADSTLIPMTPNDTGKLIGGLFVVPRHEKGGVIKMTLAGIAVKNDDGGWSLQLLVDSPKDNIVPTESTSQKVKSDKKKKQNKNADSSEPTLVK